MSCHNGAADSPAPAREALRGRSPQSIVESLMTGAMRTQGARLSGAERRTVAECLTGTPPGAWSGWSPSNTNTRFQPASEAGLTAADVPRLTLKWAFSFPDSSVAWSQPTVAGGRGCTAAQSAALTAIPGAVFSGSFDGALRAYSAATGAVIWSFDSNRTFTAVNGVPVTGASTR